MLARSAFRAACERSANRQIALVVRQVAAGGCAHPAAADEMLAAWAKSHPCSAMIGQRLSIHARLALIGLAVIVILLLWQRVWEFCHFDSRHCGI